MATQEYLRPCHLHPLHGAVCYGYGHLFASFRHHAVSWYARHLERSSPPHAVLAGFHAGPLPGAQNLGRTRPLDPCPGYGLALSPLAQGELLEYASARGMVGPRSDQHLAAAQGWEPPSCW